MKFKDMILIALICANVALASAGLTVYLARSEPMAVAAVSSRAGDYVITTGQVGSSREGVLVIDVVSKRSLMYVVKGGVTPAGFTWELMSNRDLRADFGVTPKP